MRPIDTARTLFSGVAASGRDRSVDGLLLGRAITRGPALASDP